jgi:hypothetical protein
VAKRLLLGFVGGIFGGFVGALIGIFAGYAIAEFIGVTSSETQAYFQMLVAMPAVGLLGFLTGGAAFAAMPKQPGSRKPWLAVAAAGWMMMLGTCGLGITWRSASSPAEFRVRNDAPKPLERAYLGGDFRRASQLDTVSPGQTTEYFGVDLDQRGSFAAVRGRYDDDNFSLYLDEADTPAGGKYTYVITSTEGGLALELVHDE